MDKSCASYDTHTHTHIYIYIYICVCVCVRVCVCRENLKHKAIQSKEFNVKESQR